MPVLRPHVDQERAIHTVKRHIRMDASTSGLRTNTGNRHTKNLGDWNAGDIVFTDWSTVAGGWCMATI